MNAGNNAMIFSVKDAAAIFYQQQQKETQRRANCKEKNKLVPNCYYLVRSNFACLRSFYASCSPCSLRGHDRLLLPW